MKVAVVEPDLTIQRVVEGWLDQAELSVELFESADVLLQRLSNGPEGFGVVALGLRPERGPGLAVLGVLRARDPELPVLVWVDEGDAPLAAEATREGAYDALRRPLDADRFVSAVRRALDRSRLVHRLRRLRAELDDRHGIENLVGESPKMRELVRQVDRVLDSDVAVALFGESGTGKELVARAIHHRGRRSRAPFVAINCAAIPEALHEAELFGQERGAVAGLSGLQRGRFEQAHGGTLFLDEVAELSALTQASLLRALQERHVRRVGGAEEIPVDVRLVSATRRDLDAEVRAGRFREDLYFRLVVYPIRLPPLRERTDDIPGLVNHFLRKYEKDVGRKVSRVSPEALQALMMHEWPGNVRELENVIHRSMLSTDGDRIDLEHLPPSLRGAAKMQNVDLDAPDPGDILPMRELERRAIQRALRATGGSVERAAKLLGMGRATLYRRLAKYDAPDSEG